jgi:hypothetical protein
MEKTNAIAAENAAPSVSPDVPAPPRKMSPEVPGCPPMSPKCSGRKTNPPRSADRPRQHAGEPPAAVTRSRSPITRFVLETAVMETCADLRTREMACNAAHGDRAVADVHATLSPHVPARGEEMSPSVPGCPPVSPNTGGRKTNPPMPSPALTEPATTPAAPVNPHAPRTLTPLQLAVARAFAKGGRTLAIAAAFGINRRTLSRWQRLPEFRDEIVRIHRALSQPPPRLAPAAQLQPSEREFLNHVYTSAMKQFMKI